MAKRKRTRPKPVALPDGDPTSSWTIPQLRAWAAGADVSLDGLRLKAEILAAVLEPLTPRVDKVATRTSIAKALADKVLDAELHAGPIATLLILARKIDTEDEMREVAIAWAEFKAKGDTPPKPPPLDNVSIATYRNYCESLGLTVAGAKAAPAKGGTAGGEQPKSKLVGLRSQYQGEGA
jgi:hypothetical protein